MTNQKSRDGEGAFEQWKREHKRLEQYAMELSEWLAAQSKIRAQQFKQTVGKLQGAQCSASIPF